MSFLAHKPEFVIAFIVACIIIAGGVAFCAHTRQSLIYLLRQEVEKTKDTDEASANIAAMLDQGIIPPDVEIAVPPSMLVRISISDWLARLWYVWLVAVFGVCFFAAYLVSHIFARQGGGG